MVLYCAGIYDIVIMECGVVDKTKTGIFKVVGYFVPLVQSLPPLGLWTGLMTVPLASYLVMMFANLPASLPQALSTFFTPFHLPEKALIGLGLLLLVYSVIYLRLKKGEGLVTSGPYRLMRHPQYAGIILFTIGLTSWSVWILNNTFGMGFLSSSQTLVVWFVELLAYVLLASIEERYLSRSFSEFEAYKSKTPLLISFLTTNSSYLELPLSLAIPVIVLAVLLHLPA
jgi:protein-S-isoprenylcysteine O-methyltransferase Ste14